MSIRYWIPPVGRYHCCRIFVRVAFFVFPTGADAPLKLEALHKNRKRKIAGGLGFICSTKFQQPIVAPQLDSPVIRAPALVLGRDRDALR